MARFEKKTSKKELGKPKVKRNFRFLYWLIPAVIVVGVSTGIIIHFATKDNSTVDLSEKFPNGEIITASELLTILDPESSSHVGERFPSTFYVYIYHPDYEANEIAGRSDINKAVNDLIERDEEAYRAGLLETNCVYILNLNLGTNSSVGLESEMDLSTLPVFIKVVEDSLSERSVGIGVLSVIRDLNLELQKL